MISCMMEQLLRQCRQIHMPGKVAMKLARAYLLPLSCLCMQPNLHHVEEQCEFGHNFALGLLSGVAGCIVWFHESVFAWLKHAAPE
jgi:hypothetical protein